MTKKKAVEQQVVSGRARSKTERNQQAAEEAGGEAAPECAPAMQRTGAKAKAKAKKKKRPVPCIYRHTDLELRRAFPDVCKKLLEKAGKASVSHTRLLVEIAKSGERKTKRKKQEPSLSQMLLAELKRRQDEREAAAEKAVEQNAADTQASEGAASEREEKH